MKPIKTTNWTAEGIKTLRLKYGLTQEQMAEIIGIRQQVYARMEAGTHKLGRMTEIALDRIADHLRRRKA